VVSAAVQPPSSVTTYTRLLQLGSGGMADVHLALARRQAEFQRLVVLKTIRPESTKDPNRRVSLTEEARLSARLNHPNVVQVTEIVELDGGVMLVMEYLDGLCLGDAYQAAGSAFDLRLRLRAICEALAGLHYAHEVKDYNGQPLSLVHRDISPQNIFLTYDGRVKLLDFGIAKASGSADATRTGIVKGRIAYMAPEQLRGEPLDRRADVFSMGCVLYEAIAFRRIWKGATHGEIAAVLKKGALPPLDPSLPIDQALRDIVSKATAPSREDRYTTANDMRVALEQYLEQQGGSAQVFARDVGDMLSLACEEQRERRREEIAEAVQLIEQRRSVAPTPLIPPAADQTIPEFPKDPRTPEDLTEAFAPSGRWPLEAAPTSNSVSGTGLRLKEGSRSDITQTSAAQLSKSRLFYWLAGALVLGSLALVFFDRSPGGENTAESRATLTKLILDPEPASATIYLDGQRIGQGRVEHQVERGSEHRVRAIADGFEPVERTVDGQGDAHIRLRLRPLGGSEVGKDAALEEGAALEENAAAQQEPASQKGDEAASDIEREAPLKRPKTQAARPRPSRSAPTNDSSTPNCDPPYYFSGGIKTYKPECI
jgi:serine/threonine protein kinase